MSKNEKKIKEKKELIISIGTLILLIIWYFLIIIGFDFLNMHFDIYILAPDMIAGASILCLLYSIDKIKIFIQKLLKYEKIVQKIYILDLLLFLAFIISYFLYLIGLNAILANLISFICIICSILFLD